MTSHSSTHPARAPRGEDATLLDRLMPRTLTPYTRRVAVASLASQMLIVLTGGLVRLTASGLGCSTWPRCSSDSLTATPELGIHSYIEFGNRLLTFVLIVVAALTILAVWRTGRRDLRYLALSLLLFVPFQALVGMVTVLTHLNPWVVSAHFIISMPLVAWGSLLCNRVYGTPRHTTGRLNIVLTRLVSITTAAILIAGTVLTGSGPHAGDHGAARTGLDPQVVTPFHSALIYVLIALLVILGARLGHEDKRAAKAVWLALAVVLFQGVIGYIQHFLHLPIAVVAVHMIGSTMVVAATANVAHALRAPHEA